MLDRIRGDLRLVPKVGAAYVLVTVAVSCVVFFIPSLSEIYGVPDSNGTNIWSRVTIPFIHGFDLLSGIGLLLFNLVIFYFLGSFIEKIIGGFRFLILLAVSFISYLLIHRLLLMIGHGLTPIIMTLSGVCLILMQEAKRVRPNTVYDYYYKTLWGVQIFLWVVVPVVMSIIPFYFDSTFTSKESILYGNVLLFSGFATGLLLGQIFRTYIRRQLIDYVRKNRIKHSKWDEKAWIAILVIPIYFLILFILNPS